MKKTKPNLKCKCKCHTYKRASAPILGCKVCNCFKPNLKTTCICGKCKGKVKKIEKIDDLIPKGIPKDTDWDVDIFG